MGLIAQLLLTKSRRPRKSLGLLRGGGARFSLGALLILSFISAAPAVAQTGAAYDNANCEASFLQLCPNVETSSATDSTSPLAAPLPIIGFALWECSALLLGVAISLFARRRKQHHSNPQ